MRACVNPQNQEVQEFPCSCLLLHYLRPPLAELSSYFRISLRNIHQNHIISMIPADFPSQCRIVAAIMLYHFQESLQLENKCEQLQVLHDHQSSFWLDNVWLLDNFCMSLTCIAWLMIDSPILFSQSAFLIIPIISSLFCGSIRKIILLSWKSAWFHGLKGTWSCSVWTLFLFMVLVIQDSFLSLLLRTKWLYSTLT